MDGMSIAAAAAAAAATTKPSAFLDHQQHAHHSQQQREIAIFWDYENVPLPLWCNATVAAGAVVRAVRDIVPGHRIVDRRLYFDFNRVNNIPHRPRDCAGLDSCGFDLVNTPTRNNKETLDKKLIADVLTFAWDSAARNDRAKPCVVLVTSDGDYAYTLSKLRDRGVQTIVMVGKVDTVAQILVNVADVALSLEGDVLLPEQNRLRQQQQQLHQHQHHRQPQGLGLSQPLDGVSRLLSQELSSKGCARRMSRSQSGPILRSSGGRDSSSNQSSLEHASSWQSSANVAGVDMATTTTNGGNDDGSNLFAMTDRLMMDFCHFVQQRCDIHRDGWANLTMSEASRELNGLLSRHNNTNNMNSNISERALSILVRDEAIARGLIVVGRRQPTKKKKRQVVLVENFTFVSWTGPVYVRLSLAGSRLLLGINSSNASENDNDQQERKHQQSHLQPLTPSVNAPESFKSVGDPCNGCTDSEQEQDNKKEHEPPPSLASAEDNDNLIAPLTAALVEACIDGNDARLDGIILNPSQQQQEHTLSVTTQQTAMPPPTQSSNRKDEAAVSKPAVGTLHVSNNVLVVEAKAATALSTAPNTSDASMNLEESPALTSTATRNESDISMTSTETSSSTFENDTPPTSVKERVGAAEDKRLKALSNLEDAPAKSTGTDKENQPGSGSVLVCNLSSRTANVRNLVHFLEQTYCVTVRRARIEALPHTNSNACNAHVELIQPSEAAILVEQANSSTLASGKGIWFQNRSIGIFPNPSPNWDVAGDEKSYYEKETSAPSSYTLILCSALRIEQGGKDPDHWVNEAAALDKFCSLLGTEGNPNMLFKIARTEAIEKGLIELGRLTANRGIDDDGVVPSSTDTLKPGDEPSLEVYFRLLQSGRSFVADANQSSTKLLETGTTTIPDALADSNCVVM